MDKTEALLKYFQEFAVWLELQVHDYENGTARHFQGEVDDSALLASNLRHKLRNAASVIEGYNRLRDRNS